MDPIEDLSQFDVARKEPEVRQSFADFGNLYMALRAFSADIGGEPEGIRAWDDLTKDAQHQFGVLVSMFPEGREAFSTLCTIVRYVSQSVR